MAVPKSKITKQQRGERRSHDALNGIMIAQNSVTGEDHRPHHVSPGGHYRSRQVTDSKVRP